MFPVIPTVLSEWQSCYPGVTLDLQRANPSRGGAGVTEALPISAFLDMPDGNILDKQGTPQTKTRMYIDAQTNRERWHLFCYDQQNNINSFPKMLIH